MPIVFSYPAPINIQNSANSVQPSLQNGKMHETSNTRHDLLNRSGRAQLAPIDSEFQGAQIIFHFSYFPDSILNAKRANPKIRVLEHFLHFLTRRAARRVHSPADFRAFPDLPPVGGHFT